MPEADDLELLKAAAIEAGKIAEKYFRADPKTWDKGDGQGPVTQADLEIDEMLRATLIGARPNYGWLSEETEDDAARLDAETVFIVDPIDGTRAFIDGQQTFSHSLAIARGGLVTEGAVHLPLRDKCYAAQKDRGATLNDTPLTASSVKAGRMPDVLAGKQNSEPQYWRSGDVPFKRHIRPSIAYRMALVGEGRFDGMVTLRPTWEWDVAAGALIAAEAGALVSDRRGQTLKFNNPVPQLDGVISAGARLHQDLIAKLMPVD